LADAELEKVALKEIAKGNISARNAGGQPFVTCSAAGVSEQFACRVTGHHRATQRHEPVTATPRDPDATLRSWLRH